MEDVADDGASMCLSRTATLRSVEEEEEEELRDTEEANSKRIFS